MTKHSAIRSTETTTSTKAVSFGPPVQEQPVTRPKAIATGVLKFGSSEVDCYVLEDGQRVISQRGIQAGIGAAKNGNLDRLVSSLSEKHSDLALLPSIEFTLPGNTGIAAIGRDRMFFVKLCDAYAEAWSNGELHPKQEPIARVCMAVLRSLATVGIDALIDEATGYQAVRESDYLQRLFALTLRHEATKWQLTFPHSLARALAPLWGICYTTGSHPVELHRAYGEIYEFVLGKDAATEMRRRNAKNSTKHHQLLTPDARALLSDDLRVVEMLAQQSGSKQEFWSRMRVHYRKAPLQLSWGN